MACSTQGPGFVKTGWLVMDAGRMEMSGLWGGWPCCFFVEAKGAAGTWLWE